MRLRWRYVLIPIGLVAALVLLVTAAGLAYLDDDVCSTRTSYGGRGEGGAVHGSRSLFWPSVTCSWTDRHGVTHSERVSFE
jgi:hypothetical protein